MKLLRRPRYGRRLRFGDGSSMECRKCKNKPTLAAGLLEFSTGEVVRREPAARRRRLSSGWHAGRKTTERPARQPPSLASERRDNEAVANRNGAPVSGEGGGRARHPHPDGKLLAKAKSDQLAIRTPPRRPRRGGVGTALTGKVQKQTHCEHREQCRPEYAKGLEWHHAQNDKGSRRPKVKKAKANPLRASREKGAGGATGRATYRGEVRPARWLSSCF